MCGVPLIKQGTVHGTVHGTVRDLYVHRTYNVRDVRCDPLCDCSYHLWTGASGRVLGLGSGSFLQERKGVALYRRHWDVKIHC